MKSLIIVAIFGLGACATGRAPGTNPGDMSAASHRQEAAHERQVADAYRQRAHDLNGGKGTYTAEVTADEQESIAKQHEEAARQVDQNMNAHK